MWLSSSFHTCGPVQTILRLVHLRFCFFPLIKWFCLVWYECWYERKLESGHKIFHWADSQHKTSHKHYEKYWVQLIFRRISHNWSNGETIRWFIDKENNHESLALHGIGHVFCVFVMFVCICWLWTCKVTPTKEGQPGFFLGFQTHSLPANSYIYMFNFKTGLSSHCWSVCLLLRYFRTKQLLGSQLYCSFLHPLLVSLVN